MTDLAKLTETYRESIAQMQKTLTEEMKKAFTEFFNQNPDVHALAWLQYTPYFNDGDECVFNVHDIYPANAEDLKKLEKGEISVYDLDEYSYGEKKKIGWVEKAYAFIKVLRGIDDDIMKSAFGDHVQVIATREGFDVTEYEHD